MAVALAPRAVGIHDDVPQLGPAAVEASVEHDAAADARPERERDQVGGAAARADAPLRERHRVAVVLDPDRDAEALP